jgi:hypothetical protein
MSDVLQWEKRNEMLAGIVIAATVLVVGYASGFGHVVGPLAPTLPFTASVPGTPEGGLGSTPSSVGGTGSGSGPYDSSSSTTPGVPGPTGGLAGSGSAPGSQPGSTPVVDPVPGCDPALLSAIAEPFWTHVQRGHLGESPGQQVADILDTDQYIKTHTVLLEDMLAPAYTASLRTTDAASIFWMHLRDGHLDESPGQQVGDILDTDQYVRTHTVLVEDMLSPSVMAVTGTC